MPVEIRVPELGESIVEATVGRWLKQEGEAIAAGEALVELETEKVNMEVSAAESGVLESILKQEGENVAVGEVLGIIGEDAGVKPEQQPTPAVERHAAAAQAVSQPSTPGAAPLEEENGARSTPLARRIAAEHGVNIANIKGTGPSGRVTKDDVTAYLEGRQVAPSAVPAQSAVAPPQQAPETPTPPAPSIIAPGTTKQEPAPFPAEAVSGRWEERTRMSRRRQTIARRLLDAQHTAAMLTTFNEVDMSTIMEIRRRRREAFKERYGVNLGYMSFFTRAVVGALRQHPRLNAEIQGDEIVIKHYYDIGIAVGMEEGLVVPVVRDADRLSFAEIEKQIASLAAKARNNELTLAELQGGTFTISNGGIYGSLLSTPILNTPQVGILGMHKIQERPVVVNGEIVIRPMMYLALSYDHRIVDGSEAVRFLVRVKELLEDPEGLLLEG